MKHGLIIDLKSRIVAAHIQTYEMDTFVPREIQTYYRMRTCPWNRHIARGGVSVLLTITIPLRTAALRTRLSANETHCPASAVVTVALLSTEKALSLDEEI